MGFMIRDLLENIALVGLGEERTSTIGLRISLKITSRFAGLISTDVGANLFAGWQSGRRINSPLHNDLIMAGEIPVIS